MPTTVAVETVRSLERGEDTSVARIRISEDLYVPIGAQHNVAEVFEEIRNYLNNRIFDTIVDQLRAARPIQHMEYEEQRRRGMGRYGGRIDRVDDIHIRPGAIHRAPLPAQPTYAYHDGTDVGVANARASMEQARWDQLATAVGKVESWDYKEPKPVRKPTVRSVFKQITKGT